MIPKLDIYLPELPPSVESKIDNGRTLYCLPQRELYESFNSIPVYDLTEYTRLDRIARTYGKLQSKLSEATPLSFEEAIKLANDVEQVLTEAKDSIKDKDVYYIFYERSAQACRQALKRVPSEDTRRLILLKSAGFWEMVALQEKPLSAF